ncbi:hypothetical protein [Desulfoplanes sp.]
MGLHQFSLTYDPLEDRALLRINTTENEEIQCLLTRRYSKLLRQVIRDFLQRQVAAVDGRESTQLKHIVDMEHEAYTQKNDFSKGFNHTLDASFPLGDTPVLLVKLQAKEVRDGVLLVLSCATGAKIELQLRTELMHGMLRLIDDVAGQADWNLQEGTAPHPRGMDLEGGMVQ